MSETYMIINGHEVPVSEIPQKAVKRLLKYPISLYKDWRAVKYLESYYKKGNCADAIIKVGFIVQMAEVWDKEEPVYRALKNNKKFDVKLIVVPTYSSVKKSIETDYKNNYFLSNYPDAIPAYDNGQWFDLKNKFDYIFYQRPYDHYLPDEYRSSNLVKYARCCYIPYGFSGSDNFNSGNTNKEFFRNMYITFAESDYSADLIKSIFKTQKEKVVHHVESLGYPALIPYFSIKPTKEYKRVLWTPRWSYDPKLGGSHFIEYKDTILKLKDIYPDIELTFRPHPLLFEELIVKLLMKQDSIDSYLTTLKQKEIEYDSGAPIFDTFKNTDVLITDFSTIIIQFFITGRPIIYCNSDNIVLNETYKKLAEGMYIANNENDIMKYISELQKGNDCLYEKRLKIINTFLCNHKNATANIINYVERVFYKGRKEK